MTRFSQTVPESAKNRTPDDTAQLRKTLLGDVHVIARILPMLLTNWLEQCQRATDIYIDTHIQAEEEDK